MSRTCGIWTPSNCQLTRTIPSLCNSSSFRLLTLWFPCALHALLKWPNQSVRQAGRWCRRFDAVQHRLGETNYFVKVCAGEVCLKEDPASENYLTAWAQVKAGVLFWSGHDYAVRCAKNRGITRQNRASKVCTLQICAAQVCTCEIGIRAPLKMRVKRVLSR